MVFGCELKLGCTFRYFVLVGFDGLSGCTFGGGLVGSWDCGVSLSAALGTRFMILVPGGGSLFEITSSPLGPS